MKEAIFFCKCSLILICLISFKQIAHSQERQASGLGIQGITYFSPIKAGKMYYGAYGSVNLRSEDNFMEYKFITGLQFHEKVKIIDLGATLRFFPAKKLVYIGVSPYNARVSTLKASENDVAPIIVSKGYGIGHLGLQLPIGGNANFEIEGNYNYFYESKAAGYSISIGFVFYNNDLVNSVAKSLSSKK